MNAGVGAVFVRNLVRFPRTLRAAGAHVPSGIAHDLLEALSRVDLQRREDVHAAMRAVCIRRREDLALFDAAFRAFFEQLAAAAEPGSTRDEDEPTTDGGTAQAMSPLLDEALEDGEEHIETPVATTDASPEETLRRKDFASFSDRELEEGRRLLASFHWQSDERRSHRWKPSHRGRIDIHRWLRALHRHGGDPVTWPRRERRLTQRPLVVLCDVSGSMERYSRMLVHVAHLMARQLPRVEVFVFATRLARLTRYASSRQADPLVRAIPRVAPDWAGGTRIGEALRAFNRRHGQQVLRRRPVVLLISDGWDRGDPERLETEIRRLQRSCARLIWLNPLLGTVGYEPLTRGMQAARPFVDDFLPAHNLDSLEALARVLLTSPDRRARGRRALLARRGR